MELNFYKLEGLGNDFILLDTRGRDWVPAKRQVIKWCDRHFGIGADGILLLQKSGKKDADFRMRIFNADGSEAEMCGNGIRCLALYIYERGLSRKTNFGIETRAGVMRVEKLSHRFRVGIGRAEFDPKKIPVAGRGELIGKTLKVEGKNFSATCLSVGNPHCVIPVPDLSKIDLARLGPKIERHRWFPNRVNVEFVKVISRSHLQVRVWERGAGETLACGTGACAALVACAKLGLADCSATVSLPGGDLWIEWNPNSCYLTGPARLVFSGRIKFGS